MPNKQKSSNGTRQRSKEQTTLFVVAPGRNTPSSTQRKKSSRGAAAHSHMHSHGDGIRHNHSHVHGAGTGHMHSHVATRS